jgi:hypothetical protein
VGSVMSLGQEERTHHVNRGICEVDEGRQHLCIAAGLIQRTRVPEREDGAHELDEVLLPLPIWRGTATCIAVSATDQAVLTGLTYESRCRGT